MSESDIIERLVRIETKLGEQEEDIKDIKKDLEKLTENYESRLLANGDQNVAIAKLDSRLESIENRLKVRDRGVWSAIGLAIAALLEGVISWIFRGRY